MRKTNIGILLLSCIMTFISCGNNATEGLTAEAAMDSLVGLSAIDGAKFYVKNRGSYDFMDKLYGDSILPVLPECSYFDLKNVADIVNDTPYSDQINELVGNKRSECEEYITDEITSFTNEEKEVFNTIIAPALEMTIDSLVQCDAEQLMSDYAGGLFNYKKIAFLFGRDRNDFKDMFWEKFDTLKYQDMIRSQIEDYLTTINKKQNDYSNELTGSDFEYKSELTTPSFQIGLSQSTLRHVKKYTKGESDEILESAFNDFVVPIALGAVSGGLADIYDVATIAYDIKVTMDDIKSEKVDKDDMMQYICEHDLSYQIKNYYLSKWYSQAIKHIEESNRQLKEKILENL